MRINHIFSKTVLHGTISLIAVTAAFVFTSGTPVEGVKENAIASRRPIITAAGATFPLPFYNEAFKMYWERNDVPVTYAGIGTERGIKSLQDLEIAFAGVDVPLTEEELGKMPAKTVLFPTCMGAVTVAYNLPGVKELKLTGELIADMYMGKIMKWNDTRIAAINPGVELPDKEIYPVFRLDGSGTTYIFSDYLSKMSNSWKSIIGTGKTLEFPRGVAATGNTGVAKLVERIVGSIGYVGSEYAFSYGIRTAVLQNASGAFVAPSPASITAAAASAESMEFVITNPSAPEAYPISCYTGVMLYQEQNYAGRTRKEAEETVKVLEWLVSPEVQAITSRVQFSPLPQKAVDYVGKVLKGITYDGKSLK